MRAYSLPAPQFCIAWGGRALLPLAGVASEQWSLKTVWGVGYKFEVVSGA